jgi:hypothetical protein
MGEQVIVLEENKQGFTVTSGEVSGGPSIRWIGVGEILVRSATRNISSPVALGEQLAKMEWLHLRIFQLLVQCCSATMFFILSIDNPNIPRCRRWVAQVVVTGALLFQLQALRKFKGSFCAFLLDRLRTISLYVFLACLAGYLTFVIDYILEDIEVRVEVSASCAWAAFFLGLVDVLYQVNTFGLLVLDRSN